MTEYNRFLYRIVFYSGISYSVFVCMWFWCMSLTVVIVLRAVSAPTLKSDPGTLLDTVAGITTRGMHNSSYFSLAVTNSKPPTKA